MRIPELVIEPARDEDLRGYRTWIWQDPLGGRLGLAGVRGESRFIRLDGVAIYWFEPSGSQVRALAAEDVSEEDVRSNYLRQILPIVLHLSGTQVLHASAVRTNKGVVAICGAAGVGKSTIAYGLSLHGYELWADDALPFHPNDDGILVSQVPFFIRLRPDAAAFFDLPAPPENRKLSDFRAGEPAFQDEQSLRSIVLLERRPPLGTGPDIETERVLPASALESLLPHAWVFEIGDPRSKEGLAHDFLALCASVAINQVGIGKGLDSLPERLSGLEEQFLV